MLLLTAYWPSNGIAMAKRQLGGFSPSLGRARTIPLSIPFKIIKEKGRPHRPHRPKRFIFKHLAKSRAVRSRPQSSGTGVLRLPPGRAHEDRGYPASSPSLPCGADSEQPGKRVIGFA